MQLIATEVSVCQSVCLLRSFTRLRCAKTAKRIEVLFGVKTLGGPRNTVFVGSFDSLTARGRGSAFDAAFAKLL